MTVIPHSNADRENLLSYNALSTTNSQDANVPSQPGFSLQVERSTLISGDLLHPEGALVRLQEAQNAREFEIAQARAVQLEREGLITAMVDGFDVLLTTEEWWKEIDRLLSPRETVGLRAHTEEWCEFWIRRFGREKESYEACKKWLLARRKAKRRQAKENVQEMSDKCKNVYELI